MQHLPLIKHESTLRMYCTLHLKITTHIALLTYQTLLQMTTEAVPETTVMLKPLYGYLNGLLLHLAWPLKSTVWFLRASIFTENQHRHLVVQEQHHKYVTYLQQTTATNWLNKTEKLPLCQVKIKYQGQLKTVTGEAGHCQVQTPLPVPNLNRHLCTMD